MGKPEPFQALAVHDVEEPLTSDVDSIVSESGSGVGQRWRFVAKLSGASLLLTMVVAMAAWSQPSAPDLFAEAAQDQHKDVIEPIELASSRSFKTTIMMGLAGLPGIASNGDITAVTPNSAADRAGIRRGWNLKSVNGYRYTGPASIVAAKTKLYKNYVLGRSSSVYLPMKFDKGTKKVRLDWFGITHRGNKIMSVSRGSSAQASGLRTGMKMLYIDGKKCPTSRSGAKQLVNKAKRAAFLRFLEGRSSKITMTLSN